MEYQREEVSAGLKTSIATVVFQKLDGSIRKMRCTLMKNYLPEINEEVSSKKKRIQNDDIISVWDIENGGWRSFRLDSIREISYSPVK